MVKIDTVGDVTSSGHASTSLAWDASSKTFAVATEDRTSSIRLYNSTDGGASWTLRKTFHPDYSSGVSLALTGGSFQLAFNVSGEGLDYVTGKLSSDPSTWKTTIAPQPGD